MKGDTLSFAHWVTGRLKAAGFSDAELLSSTQDDASFGNADAIFRVRSMLLRFTRDRGQEFLDIASSETPSQFFQFGDVEIAMGWKTVDEVLAKREPERFEAVLTSFAQHLSELDDAFSAGRERLTRARFERAARNRGQAFVDRLRGKE